MKRKIITMDEAIQMGLVYAGIASVGSLAPTAKSEIIKSAAEEEANTGIPCYPVILNDYRGSGLYVYADPIYDKLRDYNRHKNFSEMAYKDFVKANEILSEALNRYRSHLDAMEKLQKEFLKKGVKM